MDRRLLAALAVAFPSFAACAANAADVAETAKLTVSGGPKLNSVQLIVPDANCRKVMRAGA